MKSSLPTRIIAVVVVIALAAVFAVPAQAAGTPDVVRGGAFSWLTHSVMDWVSTLFGVDLSRADSPKADSGVGSMTEKLRGNNDPNGGAALSTTPTQSVDTSGVG